QDQEEKEGDAPRAPGVAHLDARLSSLDRVQVQHHVAQHGEDTLAVRVGDADAKDRLPKLTRDDRLLPLAPTRYQTRPPIFRMERKRGLCHLDKSLRVAPLSPLVKI